MIIKNSFKKYNKTTAMTGKRKGKYKMKNKSKNKNTSLIIQGAQNLQMCRLISWLRLLVTINGQLIAQ